MTDDNIVDWKTRVLLKLTSSKFWVSAALIVGAVATSIVSTIQGNDSMTGICLFCAVIAGACYTAVTAWQNIKERESYAQENVAQAQANTVSTTVTKTTSASATSTDKETVKAAIAPVEVEEKIGGTE